MILCLTFLIGLLLTFADANELLIEYNDSSVAYFEEKDLSVFISSKTVESQNPGQNLRYSLVNKDSLDELHFQSFILVCSFIPTAFSDYHQLALFLKNSCQSVIPIAPVPANKVSFIDECTSINSTITNLLLISFVEEKQLPYYLNNQHHSVQVNISDGSCDKFLRTGIGIESISNAFHIDFTFSVLENDLKNNDTGGLILKFGGIIGKPYQCRRLIAWVKYNDTFSFLAGSTSGLLSFDGNVHVNSTIVIRCITRSKKFKSEKDNYLTTFLSYSGHGRVQQDVSHRLHNPPVSPENPHICFSPTQNSSGFVPISDMKISRITPYNTGSAKVTVLACLSDSYSGGNLCDGNFMPIFSGSPIILPDNSSFFLGPSVGRDMLALLFFEKSHAAFCLDLDVAKNVGYMINVMLFAAPGGSIPPQSYHNIDLSCPYQYDESLSAIMYRTHTHGMGKFVSMWVEHKDSWTLLTSENRTNTIVQLSKPFHIRINDTLNVRCTYDTHGVNTTTYIGPSGEMCNFYLYYITNASSSMEIRDCFIETVLNPPHNRDGEFYHQLPRRRITFETNLELVASWSLQAQSSQGNLGICNLEHEGTILVILERYAEHFSQNSNWFNSENVLTDFRRVIKTNALTVFSMKNDSVLHTAGANRFYLPTGLFVTTKGELFITDLGLHQVIKFSNLEFHPRDAPQLVLGTAFEPGNDSIHFCKPTSVLTDHDENIYVGDGLCNQRIVKFEDDGYYVGSFGRSSFERGLPGTFGEVTDLALDKTREVILALDNKLKQIQVLDFFGNFYQVIDVSQYRNVLKICYSPDMDAILILASFELESDIFILDPVTGLELNFISGATRRFTAITIIPGKNIVLIGDMNGMITMYSGSRKVTNELYKNALSKVHDFSIQKVEVLDESLSKLSPLIHFLYKPGLADLEEPPKGRRHKFSRRLTMIISASAVAILLGIVGIVFTVTFCGSCSSKRDYDKCMVSDSDEEDVLYDTLHESYENMRAL